MRATPPRSEEGERALEHARARAPEELGEADVSRVIDVERAEQGLDILAVDAGQPEVLAEEEAHERPQLVEVERALHTKQSKGGDSRRAPGTGRAYAPDQHAAWLVRGRGSHGAWWTGRRAKEASTARGAPHLAVAVEQIEEFAQRLGARSEVDVRRVPAAARVVHGCDQPLELEVGLSRDSDALVVTRGSPYVPRHTRH